MLNRACIWNVKGGWCRNWTLKKGLFCRDHQQLVDQGVGPFLAPIPSVLILKYYCGGGLFEELSKFDEKVIHKAFYDKVSQNEEHKEHAKKFELDPYRFWEPRVGSGMMVFGNSIDGKEEGIDGVNFNDLWTDEIAQFGFGLSDFHWYERAIEIKGGKHKGETRTGATLVLVYKYGLKEEKNVPPELQTLFSELFQSSWLNIVWTFPPNEEEGEKNIVHVVEGHSRKVKNKGNFSLRFLNGIWALEPTS